MRRQQHEPPQPNTNGLPADAAFTLGDPPGDARIIAPLKWGEWGVPDEDVAELFAAAAAFYRVAPWRFLEGAQLLTIKRPSKRSWTAGVLGNAGEEFGLALYELREDFAAIVESDDPHDQFAGTRGTILSLTFDHKSVPPKAMRREVETHKWEIAGSRAWPLLFAINAAGGLTRDDFADLSAFLRAIPEFVERHHDVLTGESDASLPLTWVDELTGVEIRYDGFELELGATLWGPHDELEPSLATGPGAEPAARLVGVDSFPGELEEAMAREAAVVDRFASALMKGVHARPRVGATAARRLAEDARLFVDFLTGTQGVPVRAVSELDLRVFLYDWYPRKVVAPLSAARGVHKALIRLFEFLADDEGIICEWAEEIFDEREFFELRVEEFPGGHWWDAEVQDWQQEVWDDLDARVMAPHQDLGDGFTWGATMGVIENSLYTVAQREWMLWREEVIRGGATAPEAVLAALIPRQQTWFRTKRDDLGGKTPLQAITAERARGPRSPRGQVR